TGENQVGVGIYKTGDYGSALGVNHPVCPKIPLDFFRSSQGGDHAILNGQSSLGDDLYLPLLYPSGRPESLGVTIWPALITSMSTV
ncbi:MAG: hypothetical protein HY326_09165, partial [Chloroflexi bacterium]|nr:hypothetical protein [Chloroflexota bacterium]